MMNETILGLIAGSITIVSSFIVVFGFYLHKKSKRTILWETPTSTQSVTSSAPISRRSSQLCLINIEKQLQTPRPRSASFGEDLSARLQILAADSCYRSYSPATITPAPRSTRPSLTANIRFPVVPNVSPTIPAKTTIPSVTFQVRYEQTIETLFITIFQLHDYTPTKNIQHIFLILYLLPNDDEQRQTQSSTNGVFNEHFYFLLKPNDLIKRTLRLTAYTVDSTTRIRTILGHVFIKFDQFTDVNNDNKTFSTNTLSECFIQDLQMKSNQLGELVLTNCYLKDKNLIQIRIQQMNQLKIKFPSKAYLSGQTSTNGQKHQWTNTSTFNIPSSSVPIDQELNLTTRPSLISTNNDQVECHLRLHLHGSNQIHSHARWQQSLQSNIPHTLTIPLVAM